MKEHPSGAAPAMGESDACMRKRLFNSLSQSFPGSALSKALHSSPDSDDEDMKPDRLSSSCFAELRMERNNDNYESDDDLTSLEWLQEKDLLKHINTNEDQKENGNPISRDSLPLIRPSHIPYNPYKHINSKPPYSFSCLIFMAVEDSMNKRLPVKDIYNWIMTHFPYFQNAASGWKNSVRHNLSLNKCFKKVDKDRGQAIGKGSLWCIDPDYRPHLLQALRKTPYHPYHQLQMLAAPQISLQGFVPTRPFPFMNNSENYNQLSPHLFPFLSKRLSESKTGLDNRDIEIANTLVALKSRSQSANCSPNSRQFRSYRKRLRSSDIDDVIYTCIPSDDHTYSTIDSPGGHNDRSVSPSSSIDDEYDFGSNAEDFTDYSSCPSDYDEVDGTFPGAGVAITPRKRKIPLVLQRNYATKKRRTEDEENKKIAEGANALLNLAGITNTHIVSLRSVSPDSGKNVTPVSSSTDLVKSGFSDGEVLVESSQDISSQGSEGDNFCKNNTDDDNSDVNEIIANVNNTDLSSVIPNMESESDDVVLKIEIKEENQFVDVNCNLNSSVGQDDLDILSRCLQNK